MPRLATGILLMALALPAFGAPKAELWERWTRHGDNKVAIDHGLWTQFLKDYLRPGRDGISRFAYSEVSDADHRALQEYLTRMQAVPVRKFPRAEQQAYWINLYNALTVKVVLDHYPVDSIMKINISPGFFARGPWRRKLLTVENEEVSLDDIEHRILRPIWKDPRIHYAVNCASIGCPNLAPIAYTAGNTEELLERGARDYVNHARGARVENGRLVVSSIYHWFKDDFGGSDAGVIAHLKQYAKPGLAKKLSGVSRISSHEYDWGLNGAK
jgi:hypothetical protein